jgi:ketosteroid isomerase-like protein
MMQTDTNTATELVSGGYASFATGDIPDVLARFASDIAWTIPGPSALADTYNGPDGVASFFGQLQQAYTRLEVHADEIRALDDERVLALGHHTGEGAGGSFDVGFAHVWRVRDGKAVAFFEYTDTEALGRAMG